MLFGEREIVGAGAWVTVNVCAVPFKGVIVMVVVLVLLPCLAQRSIGPTRRQSPWLPQ